MNIDELLLPELKHLAKPLDKILLASDAILRLTEQYPTVDKIERVIKNSIGENKTTNLHEQMTNIIVPRNRYNYKLD